MSNLPFFCVLMFSQGEDRELIELLPLCVTYFIVFLYLAFSVGELEYFKIEFIKEIKMRQLHC